MPQQPAWSNAACPQGLQGPRFLHPVFLHMKDVGRKAAMQGGSCHGGGRNAPHCTVPSRPHPWVPWRVHAASCRLPAVPWPGCFLPGVVPPVSTKSLFSAGDGGTGLRGRRTPHWAHAFCQGCVPQSTVGIKKYLKLETGFWMRGAPGKLCPMSS